MISHYYAGFPLSESMVPFLIRWLVNDEGQDLLEYVLLGAVVALAGLVVMNTFDDVMNFVYASWDSSTQAIWEPQDPQ